MNINIPTPGKVITLKSNCRVILYYDRYRQSASSFIESVYKIPKTSRYGNNPAAEVLFKEPYVPSSSANGWKRSDRQIDTVLPKGLKIKVMSYDLKCTHNEKYWSVRLVPQGDKKFKGVFYLSIEQFNRLKVETENFTGSMEFVI